MILKRISNLVVVSVIATANLVNVNANPDEDIKTAAQKLTGGTSRDWVFTRMEKVMGSSDGCKQGEIYRFAADHKLIDEQCVNGHIHDQTKSWTLEQGESPLDVILKIDGEPFILLFKDEMNGLSMILRQRAGTKIVTTEDREFRFETE